MILILMLSIAASIAAWWKGRPKRWLFPSDVFFIVCVLTVGVVPLLNPGGESESNPFSFAPEVIRNTQLGLSIMFAIFAAGWLLRRPISVKVLFPKFTPREESRLAGPEYSLLKIIILGLIALNLVFLAYSPFMSYKLDVLRFLTGELGGQAYAEARRLTYAGDPIIGEIIGRLRYTIASVTFVLIFIYLSIRFGNLVALCGCIVFFVAGPASLSKAPVFIYLSYLVFAWLALKGSTFVLRIKTSLILTAIAIPCILLIQTGLYYLQYPANFSSIADMQRAFSLSAFRTFTAVYVGLLKLFEVYPSFMPFSGFESFGFGNRNLDVELVEYYLGSGKAEMTSFPTIFIGNAYGSFGWPGLVVYSALIVAYLYFLDRVLLVIRSRYLRISYYSTASINVIFIAMVAAPTALLTYGLAVIPLVILGIDRIINKQAATTGNYKRPLPRKLRRPVTNGVV